MSDLTRRSWIVNISQGAIGVSLAHKVNGAVEDFAPSVDSLPAGVYEASRDHLGHALMNSERYHPIPAGCPTDYVLPRGGPFQPSFFSKPEFEVIRQVTQLLLGEDLDITEVAEWVDLRVSSAEGIEDAFGRVDPRYRSLAAAYIGAERERHRQKPVMICREGMQWLLRAAQDQYAKEFMALESRQQVLLLDLISDARTDKHVENAGTRLFDFLKAETIRGFYTSEIGLKELDVKGNAYYARSPGCSSM